MADVKIAGKNVPQWALWGGAGVVVVGGVLYYKNKKSQASSSSSNSSAIDPLTGLPYSQDSTIDPLTGMTYLQEAQQYGSVAAAEQSVSASQSASNGGFGAAGGGGYSGYGYGYPTSNVGPTSSATTFTSNAQWGQSAIAALEQLGYSSTDSTTAISAYLAGMTLTTSQAQLVQIAIGELGEPPNPLPVNITPAGSNSGGSGSGGSGSGGPITVAPTGLHVVRVNGLSITVGWDAVKVPANEGPLAGYTVAYGQSPDNTPYELSVGPGTTQATITFNSGPGAHGLTHYFVVWARPASPGGPHAGPVSAKTQ